MSAQQWFNEVEAVVGVLQEWVGAKGDRLGTCCVEVGRCACDEDEFFTAVWQAAELLARAHAVLMPMYQLEAMKRLALDIPDPQREAPKAKKKAHLYGPDGKPL